MAGIRNIRTFWPPEFFIIKRTLSQVISYKTHSDHTKAECIFNYFHSTVAAKTGVFLVNHTMFLVLPFLLSCSVSISAMEKANWQQEQPTTQSKIEDISLQTYKLEYKLLVFNGHEDGINALVCSPTGKTFLTGSNDWTASVWDVTSGKRILRITTDTGSINCVGYGSQGTTIITGSHDRTARLWDSITGDLLMEFKGEHTGSIQSLSVSKDELTLLTSSEDKTICMWNMKTGKLIRRLQGHTYSVSSTAFSPIGGIILTGSWDGTACLWDTQTGILLKQKKQDGLVNSVAFRPDGKMILIVTDDKTYVWDVLLEELLMTLQDHSNPIRRTVMFAGAFSPDGAVIVIGTSEGTIQLWDSHTEKKFLTIKIHEKSINSVAFSPDGTTIITGSADKTASCLYIPGLQKLSSKIKSDCLEQNRHISSFSPLVN
nr:WD40 repeat domain-containing protein [Candidatus Dependentiae bacterium]